MFLSIPRDSANNASDVDIGNAEQFGEFLSANPSSMEFPDLLNLSPIKFLIWVCFAFSSQVPMPRFIAGVLKILLLIPKPKVSRINTRWVISIRAIVKHFCRSWYITEMQNPARSVGIDVRRSVEGCETVTRRQLIARPYPAGISVFNFGEESFWESGRVSHASLKLNCSCISSLILLLSAFGACAQLPVVPLQTFTAASSTTTPGTLGARYWWVASDNPLNVKVTNWVDRIQGLVFTNANNTLRPTNSSTGVGFDGTTWLTNGAPFWIGTPDITGHTGTLWVVFTPTTPSTTDGAMMVASAGYGVFTGNGNTFLFFGNSGNGTISAFASGVTYDLTVVKTNVNANLAFYTNAVARTAFVAGDYSGNGFGTIGNDSTDAFFYKGKILEMAFFYSNLTTTTISTLHTYATNTYGYSP